jgi:hypothetical protein
MISNLTNSEIGSQHWYNTLLAKIESFGRYMRMHRLTPQQEATWGKMMIDYSKELIDNYDSIQDSYRTITFKPSETIIIKIK